MLFYNFSVRYKEGPINHVPDMLYCQVASLIIGNNSPQKLAREQEIYPHLIDIRCCLKDSKVPQRKLSLPLAEFELKGDIHRLQHLPDLMFYQLVAPSNLRNWHLILVFIEHSRIPILWIID